jgi:hypothetical protein
MQELSSRKHIPPHTKRTLTRSRKILLMATGLLAVCFIFRPSLALLGGIHTLIVLALLLWERAENTHRRARIAAPLLLIGMAMMLSAGITMPIVMEIMRVRFHVQLLPDGVGYLDILFTFGVSALILMLVSATLWILEAPSDRG